MTKLGRTSPAACAVAVSLIILAPGWVASDEVSQAQSSPCPTEKVLRFPPATVVYLDINSPARGTNVGTQINNAADKWTAANTNSNASGITFNTSTPLTQVPPSAPVLHVAFEAFTRDAPAVGPDTDTRARMVVNAHDGIYISDATIFFNTRALANTYNLDGRPFYDPESPGYDTIYEKITLHEIGHGMGLDHPANETAGESVMNTSAECPNDAPNDVCNHNPTTITPCDNTVTNNVYYDPPPPPPTPGGGSGSGGGGSGGGGGGGGATTCSGYSYYYYESSGGCTQTYERTLTWCDDGSSSDETEYIGEGCVLD